MGLHNKNRLFYLHINSLDDDEPFLKNLLLLLLLIRRDVDYSFETFLKHSNLCQLSSSPICYP